MSDQQAPSKPALIGMAGLAILVEVLLATPSAALFMLALWGIHALSHGPWIVCTMSVVVLMFLSRIRTGVTVEWGKLRDMWSASK